MTALVNNIALHPVDGELPINSFYRKLNIGAISSANSITSGNTAFGVDQPEGGVMIMPGADTSKLTRIEVSPELAKVANGMLLSTIASNKVYRSKTKSGNIF